MSYEIVKKEPGWYVYPTSYTYNVQMFSGPVFKGNELVYLTDWCKKNLSGHWIIVYNYLFIETLEDITLFKLSGV